ncbi:hypothetical protein A2U01_0113574, partial [Trifolium medium]|nr:hypothetical protein [Trifolium medium]
SASSGDARQCISGSLASPGEHRRLSRSASTPLAQRLAPGFEAQVTKMALVTPKTPRNH